MAVGRPTGSGLLEARQIGLLQKTQGKARLLVGGQSGSALCSSRRKARQVDQPGLVRYSRIAAAVEARVVEQQRYALAGLGVGRRGEGFEQAGEH